MNARTALITGASSGIGADLATTFAQEGWHLVLVARREDRLEQLAQDLEGRFEVPVHLIPADLALPGSAELILRQLERSRIQVDALVNSAGFGSWGPFVESDLQRDLDMIQVNVSAVVHLTHLLLPAMLARGSGHILNVASTAAFQPGPLMAIYYASKAFVLSFSEALSVELAQSGVSVTALCPGPTRTEFQAVADLAARRLQALLPVRDAPTMAQLGYRAMLKRQRLAIPGWGNRLTLAAVRFIPRALVLRIVHRLQERRRGAAPAALEAER